MDIQGGLIDLEAARHLPPFHAFYRSEGGGSTGGSDDSHQKHH